MAAPVPNEAPGIPPELIDHPQYHLERELGRGGMGVVYLARNKLMDRPEVLKVVARKLLARPGAVERFLREIRSAARLNHPNVVAAYSALQVGDLIALVMEYVPGEDLATQVKANGPFPVANACYYIFQAAQGLQHAHEKGMIHRDIKPANLILTRDGKKHVVKILDFGLAKATTDKLADDVGSDGSAEEGAGYDLTGAGQILGTPDFIAPEQTLDAAKADIRADIYSLGCTLYYLIAGRAPYKAKTLEGLLRAHHVETPEALTSLRPDVPTELSEIVAKMMAKNPADRFQTPGDVARVLVPFVKGATAAPTNLPTVAATAAGNSPSATGSSTSTSSPAVTVIPSSAEIPKATPAPAPAETLVANDPTQADLPTKEQKGGSRLPIPLILGGAAVVVVGMVGIGLMLSGLFSGGSTSSTEVTSSTSTAPTTTAPTTATGSGTTTSSSRTLVPPAGPLRKAQFGGPATWKIEGNELVSDGKPGGIWFGDSAWTSYDLAFTAKVDGRNGFGAGFRGADIDNHYYFLVGSGAKKTLAIEAKVRGKLVRATDKSLLALPAIIERKTDILTDGVSYRVLVEVRNDSVNTYIDGRKIYSDVKLRAMPSGRPGIVCLPLTTVRATDIVVRGPAGRLLWEGLPDLP